MKRRHRRPPGDAAPDCNDVFTGEGIDTVECEAGNGNPPPHVVIELPDETVIDVIPEFQGVWPWQKVSDTPLFPTCMIAPYSPTLAMDAAAWRRGDDHYRRE